MTARRAVLAEFAGTALLLAVVVGSGIAGQQLAGGNVAIALLANSIATGAGLYVLITLAGPVSGAHFNPIVSLYAWLSGGLSLPRCIAYIAAQVAGGIAGVWLTHLMYALPPLQASATSRSGPAQWLSEVVASLLLVGAIHLALQTARDRIPLLVALLVTAGYWFTASTFFANPAVTIARSLTDTFAGIAPADAPAFVVAQLLGLALVLGLIRSLSPAKAGDAIVSSEAQP